MQDTVRLKTASVPTRNFRLSQTYLFFKARVSCSSGYPRTWVVAQGDLEFLTLQMCAITFWVCGAGDGTQGFTHARDSYCHMSYTSAPPTWVTFFFFNIHLLSHTMCVYQHMYHCMGVDVRQLVGVSSTWVSLVAIPSLTEPLGAPPPVPTLL